ncbi:MULTISPECIES: sensor histidine kinase [Bacillaceae]|jgi:signal transduction histidine kinase|uniref:sensor histidine kinase n=1 Tax=Bacillaceae TaxID=186817 RepID=UPI0005A42A65|nr:MULTISPECIES: sensor histidine kinase [Bacillaceae]MCB5936083.1 sensor histidine kinase [Bacillus sp. DFI.2.34]AWI13439.1 sensor histidine kinase [Caldibacillus thermoamylovorans]MBU5342197.1 sensor histidine kinase [Caldifermentibacillus hisashii]MCB7070643.1 sensor histidine kinase [Caldibacillus sp. 210928-DFI.2.22]MCB7074191.1 sensor histidine kinase [Caldibacillus sp. 210928-DFI.2.18]
MKNYRENLLLLYLHKNWRPLGLSTLFVLCFTIVFSLSHLPLAPILYAVLLCLYIGLIFFIVDFLKFIKRYKMLKIAHKTITVQINQLPVPQNAIERQYQELLQILYKHKNELTIQADNKQKDLVDYFTQWTHQIKTPIAAMRLLLQSDQTEQNSELEMELMKIEQYVEFVLQYLRLENMSNDLVLKKYDLDGIIKQAIRKNAKLFIRKKISLNYAGVNFTVLTDEKWLLFVIEQILSNALKYTKEGSISIYTKGKRLIIEDTGIGIRAEDLPRVFEKGFTGYNGRAFKQSTGIGLYLCKQILAKLSHDISIQSEVGKGTKVIIDLEMKEIGVE